MDILSVMRAKCQAELLKNMCEGQKFGAEGNEGIYFPENSTFYIKLAEIPGVARNQKKVKLKYPALFRLTCPIYFRFLVAILIANDSGLPPLPGRLATIPSQPRTLTAAVTHWPTGSFIQPQNRPKRKYHLIVVYGPLPSNR
jgi:hypothetical protein